MPNGSPYQKPSFSVCTTSIAERHKLGRRLNGGSPTENAKPDIGMPRFTALHWPASKFGGDSQVGDMLDPVAG